MTNTLNGITNISNRAARGLQLHRILRCRLGMPVQGLRLGPAVLVLACLLVLGGCGFRLRSVPSFPQAWQPMELISLEQFDDIDQAVSRVLNQHSISLVQRIEGHNNPTARSRLRIKDEERKLQDIVVSDINTQQMTTTWSYTLEVFDPNNGWETTIQRGYVSDYLTFSLSGNTNESNPEFRDYLLTLRIQLAEQLVRSISKI